MPRLETKRYRCSAFGRPCGFPALSAERQPHRLKSTIADYEGLFIDYGYRETSYPYTQQNDYTDEAERDVPVAVLENELLYAEFLPTLGGRLWRLFDKKRQKDVLYTNDVIRFRNLSVRNAWFSGGVEWNCGVIGHSPFTCSQMYCAAVTGKKRRGCFALLRVRACARHLLSDGFLAGRRPHYGGCAHRKSKRAGRADVLAVAYLRAGDAKRAEEILLSDGGLQLLDYREGDRMLDTLYRGIRKALYRETDAQITVPEQFDFIVADFGGEKDG